MLTGVKVSHSTLQRFVQREDWCELKITEPIEELSADGGMVRLRTGAGQPGEWREYKALNVHKQGGLRVKLPGAQWLPENVPLVLKHR